jgi:hypothetical protein
MPEDRSRAVVSLAVTAPSSASRLAARTLADRARAATNSGLLADRIAALCHGDQSQSARIAAFVSELQITLEAAPPGSWDPFNLRRDGVTIPCEAWTRTMREPSECDIESAIQCMATVHSVGAPARGERMRALRLLGQEGYDYLVSAIGPREGEDANVKRDA